MSRRRKTRTRRTDSWPRLHEGRIFEGCWAPVYPRAAFRASAFEGLPYRLKCGPGPGSGRPGAGQGRRTSFACWLADFAHLNLFRG